MATSEGCGKSTRRHDHSRTDIHHIYPRHRIKAPVGNPYKAQQRGLGGNTARVCRGCHEIMNMLVGGDATPIEIIEFLVDEMWNGQEFWVEEFLKGRGKGV